MKDAVRSRIAAGAASCALVVLVGAGDAPRTPPTPATKIVGTPASPCGTPGAATGALQLTALDGNGTVRDYVALVPARYDSKKPLAITFVYHGAGSSSAIAETFGLQDAPGAADASIFVFPQGIPFQTSGVGWDDSCAGYDMVFFDNMLGYLSSTYCIDTQRVFAAGFSWGCDHVTALACCRGDHIRAIAAASCSDEFADPANYLSYKNLACPVTSAAAIRFTHDAASDGAYTQQMFATTSQLYRSFNSCTAASKRERRSCQAYVGCAHPTIECDYPGLGHALPPDWAQATWKFLSEKPKPASP